MFRKLICKIKGHVMGKKGECCSRCGIDYCEVEGHNWVTGPVMEGRRDYHGPEFITHHQERKCSVCGKEGVRYRGPIDIGY